MAGTDEPHPPPMNRAERRALAAKTRQRTPQRCACCAPQADAHDHDASHVGQPGHSDHA
ncbi:hypothetical protein BH10PSE12_BH10PSE12_08380 [soil metagenome]